MVPRAFAFAFTVTGAGYLVVWTFLVVSGQGANRVAKTFANEAETAPCTGVACWSRGAPKIRDLRPIAGRYTRE